MEASPIARATVRGNSQNPRLSGTVLFYPADMGTLVVAEVFGLPRMVDTGEGGQSVGPFYAFHVHEGTECGSGDGDNPFAESGSHYNPTGTSHPMHAGDMPPLLADSGYAYASFYTGRFTPEQVIGRTVIIHKHADDFHTQPSGNAGEKIACGKIAGVAQPG